MGENDTWLLESEITCPYCDYEYSDCWEWSESDNDYTCENCGKHFSYERRVSVDYYSSKDCKLNNE